MNEGVQENFLHRFDVGKPAEQQLNGAILLAGPSFPQSLNHIPVLTLQSLIL